MIKSLNFKKINLPMIKPFKISLGSTDFYEGFIVTLETDDGIKGYGEATTTPFITGDTIGSIESELTIFSEALKNKEESPEELNLLMKSLCKSAKASRMAVDEALWDIIGKRGKMNVKKMLGNYRNSIATSYTVDLVGPSEARKQATELLSQGVKIFKIKMGRGIMEDLERVKTVREVIGNDLMIYVDFNQAYNARKAVEISKHLSRYNIEFLEQPVNMFDIKGLKFIRDRSDIPVFADETIFSPDDVINVLQTESVDGINIKLMKSGGITESIQMVDIAESFRAPVMIGCMVETRLANTAGLVVALAKHGVKYADLDGYSNIARDIASLAVTFKSGELTLPEIPGVGVELDKEFVNKELGQKN